MDQTLSMLASDSNQRECVRFSCEAKLSEESWNSYDESYASK